MKGYDKMKIYFLAIILLFFNFTFSQESKIDCYINGFKSDKCLNTNIKIKTNSIDFDYNNMFNRDVIEINFDEINAPCGFVDTSPIYDQYAEFGIIFEGVSNEDGGSILNECGNFGVNGYSPPNFLAFNTQMGASGSAQKINFTENLASYVEIGIAQSYEGDLFSIYAYNSNDVLIATNTLYPTSDLSILSLGANDISYVIIENSQNNFSPYWIFDDLKIAFLSCEEGDLSLDGIVNIIDVIIMINCILNDNCAYDECFDLNGDQVLNIQDVIDLMNLILTQ